MEWSSNSLGDVQVNAVSSTERASAYEKGDAGQWQRLQHARKRLALLYRLSNVLALGDFGEAHHIVQALGEDEIFLGSTIASYFAALETAVAEKNVPGAQEALSHLVRPHAEQSGPSPHEPVGNQDEVLDGKDILDDHGSLDVIA